MPERPSPLPSEDDEIQALIIEIYAASSELARISAEMRVTIWILKKTSGRIDDCSLNNFT